LKEARVLEVLVDGKSERIHDEFAMFDDCRHGSGTDIGPRSEQQVDVIDVKQLGVDRGNESRIALVIVVDEFHRATEQSAFGVDIRRPDLSCQQHLSAIDREPTSQGLAKTKFDRFGSENGRRFDRRQDDDGGEPSGQRGGHSRPRAGLRGHALLP
jgi:hypothetical protein